MTYTYATLEVSAATYDEIELKLREAGYREAIRQQRAAPEQYIDLSGIGLVRAEEEQCAKTRN